MVSTLTDTQWSRLWTLVDVTPSCWRWQGQLDRDGYAHFAVKGKTYRAARLVYEAIVGPISPGLVLDHVRDWGCRYRDCVNPGHLEPVTQAENLRRGDGGPLARARTHCPQGHPYDEENTYIGPRGDRNCRACRREGMRRARSAASPD